MKEYTLQFINPIFRQGYNTTCRLGSKHYLALLKYTRKCKNKGITPYLRLKDITGKQEDLVCELVSLSCVSEFLDVGQEAVSSNYVYRTYVDLWQGMKEAYEGFTHKNAVTVIGF